MAAGDFVVQGTGTLPVSLPGVVASVDVTATGAAVGDTVVITPTSSLPRVANLGGFNGMYVYSVGTNTFTVKSNQPELTTAVTFTFIVFDAA